MSAWAPGKLPGCFGHPCEELCVGAHTARVWQASVLTARGAWCWSIDGGTVQVTRGNRGTAKSAARRVLASEVSS